MSKWIRILLVVVLLGVLVWRLWPVPEKDTVPTDMVKPVTLMNPSGPTVIPLSGIAGGKITGNVPIEIKYWKTTDEAIAALSAEKADFAVLPITTAANIYTNGIKISLLGVHEWKVFYLVAANQAGFDNWQSLKGKEVYVAVGKGTTVDLLLRSALSDAGLVPDQDVKFVYAPPQEIVALFKADKAFFAALPEPFVTLAMADNKARIAVDFQEYWGDLNQSAPRIPIAGLFVKTAYLAANPQATNDIVSQFKDSIEWSNNNIDEALLINQDILPIPAPAMKASLQRTDFYFIPIDKCQSEVETYLQKMQQLYPEGIKTLPDKGFYIQ
ncbi:MAG: ABC transporter substrate-binding protein [Syntrophomonadaceae bacterium]|nr:ABC transporter substrate-binding protein [Syntrophomonadaceae bacterium]